MGRNHRSSRRGAAHTEAALLVMVLCAVGTSSLSLLGLAFNDAVAGNAHGRPVGQTAPTPVPSTDRPDQHPRVSLSGQAALGAVRRIASSLVVPPPTVRNLDVPAAPKFSSQIPLRQIQTLADDVDGQTPLLSSVVVDVEVTGSSDHTHPWALRQLGIAAQEDVGGKPSIVTRFWELPVLEGHQQSARASVPRPDGQAREVVSMDDAYAGLGLQMAGRPMAAQNSQWDRGRLLYDFHRLSSESQSDLRLLDALPESTQQSLQRQVDAIASRYRTLELADYERALDTLETDVTRLGSELEGVNLKRAASPFVWSLRRGLEGGPVLDTLALFRQYTYDGRSNALGAVAERLGVALDLAHEADYDAFATLAGLRVLSQLSEFPATVEKAAAYEKAYFDAVDAIRTRTISADADALRGKKLKDLKIAVLQINASEPRKVLDGDRSQPQRRAVDLGLTWIEDGKIAVDEKSRRVAREDEGTRASLSTLVRPARHQSHLIKSEFAPVDVSNAAGRAHGLFTELVEDEKTFLQQWSTVRKTLDRADVVAVWDGHEASVLSQDLFDVIAHKGSDALPASLRRKFITVEDLVDGDSLQSGYEKVLEQNMAGLTGSAARRSERVAEILERLINRRGDSVRSYDEVLKRQKAASEGTAP